MNLRAQIENCGGRRFILCLLVGLSATMLQFLNKLDPAGNTYMWVMVGIVGAYITGNTVQKTKGVPDAPKPESPAA